MTIALASRGYLCFRPIIPPGTPPSIIGAAPDKPAIKTAAVRRTAAPTIVGAAVGKPSLKGAVVDPDPPATVGPPKITQATSDKPSIRKIEKD